jgi:hypothetical protein
VHDGGAPPAALPGAGLKKKKEENTNVRLNKKADKLFATKADSSICS